MGVGFFTAPTTKSPIVWQFSVKQVLGICPCLPTILKCYIILQVNSLSSIYTKRNSWCIWYANWRCIGCVFSFSTLVTQAASQCPFNTALMTNASFPWGNSHLRLKACSNTIYSFAFSKLFVLVWVAVDQSFSRERWAWGGYIPRLNRTMRTHSRLAAV